MKNLIVILISVTLLTSCATQKTIELANGKMVTEKKFARLTHRAFRKSFGKMSKEDTKLFEDTKISVDTTYSGN